MHFTRKTILLFAALVVVAIAVRSFLAGSDEAPRRQQEARAQATPTSRPEKRRASPTPGPTQEPARQERHEDHPTSGGIKFTLRSTTPKDPESSLVIAQKISNLEALFRQEKDPFVRGEYAFKLGDIHDPQAIRLLIDLLAAEKDPDVRYEIIKAIAWSDARTDMAGEIANTLKPAYAAATDPTERIAIQNTMSDVASPTSVDFLRSIYADPNAGAELKLNSAECLLRLRVHDETLLPPDEARTLNDYLRQTYQTSTDPAIRAHAIMAMGLDVAGNTQFFRDALENEKDINVQKVLADLITMTDSLEQNKKTQADRETR